MRQSLDQVAVLGAGTMGAQIAAHLANAGMHTLLLDLPSEGPDPSALARGALKRLAVIEPAPLFSPQRARLIEVGNFDTDLGRLADCQWIIECVVENLKIKRELMERVEGQRRPGTLVSTNTSGLPVAEIAAGRSEDFRGHWMGTHFFNPPRYMKLLELIPTAETRPEVVETMRVVADRVLGKGTVMAKDRPGFVANRIGCFVAARTMRLMQELDLTIEEVELLTGPLIGFPKTATFRLADLVGLDVLLAVLENLHQNLPEDPWRESFRPPAVMRELVDRGWTGHKAGRGFYRKEEKEILVLDPETFQYRQRRRAAFPSVELVRNESRLSRRLQALLQVQDQAGAFLWPFLRDLFVYSASRIPEITDDYPQIDRAMRWGFNWEQGPFELWQALGVEQVAERMGREGQTLPQWCERLLSQERKQFYVADADRLLVFDGSGGRYRSLSRDPEKIELTLLKQRERVIRSNAGASLIDLGEGVACLEFHSKMNAIGGDILEMGNWAVREVERNFLGLVIGNQGQNFSVGANLILLLLEAQEGNWEEIDWMVRSFQKTCMGFRYSARPVVAAPFQRVLGGGAEVCLGCDAVAAAAETYMGLVEVGVGLIPAGGGTKEMLRRHLVRTLPGADLMPAVRRAFEIIGRARVSRSAEEARELGLLGAGDAVEMNGDRLLFRAREKVLRLAAAGYRRPEPDTAMPVMGSAGLSVLKVGIHLMKEAGYISQHDALIGTKLGYVLTGGDLNHPASVSEQYLLDLEREAFLSLCGQPKTLERIQHTLKTGKPLRN